MMPLFSNIADLASGSCETEPALKSAARFGEHEVLPPLYLPVLDLPSRAAKQ